MSEVNGWIFLHSEFLFFLTIYLVILVFVMTIDKKGKILTHPLMEDSISGECDFVQPDLQIWFLEMPALSLAF